MASTEYYEECESEGCGIVIPPLIPIISGEPEPVPCIGLIDDLGRLYSYWPITEECAPKEALDAARLNAARTKKPRQYYLVELDNS